MTTVYTLAVRGGTPIPLPNPSRDMAETPEKVGSEQLTAAGQRVQQTVAVKRTWTLPYNWLTDAQYDELLKWFDGRRGNGPFELRENGVSGYRSVNVVGQLERRRAYVGRCATTMVLREV